MKREHAQLSRFEQMLEADKEEWNEEGKRVACRDFERVAREYFELCGDCTVTVERDEKGLNVNFRFCAVRVKNFLKPK